MRFSTPRFTAVLIAPLLQCAVASAHAQRLSAAQLPGDRDFHFKRDSFTWSLLLELRRDGTYRKINASHFAARQSDAGTWQQRADGTVELASAQRMRDIEATPLRIFLHNEPTNVARLPELRVALREFLQRSLSESFPADEVAAAFPHRFVTGSFDQDAPDIHFDGWAGSGTSHRISRLELEKLDAAIGEFLDGKTRNIFSLRPARDGHRLVLLEIGSLIASPLELLRHRKIYRCRRTDATPDVFTWIDPRVFARENGAPHPFLFHPEMNDQIHPGDGTQP